MSNWNIIKTNGDIKVLLEEYCHFHDSCIISMNYETGAFVDDTGAMGYGSQEEKKLHLFFKSQMVPKALELCFIGVRQFCMAGWQDRYFSEIFDCYLSIHTDLIPHTEIPLIVWADWSGFSFEKIEILHEPMSNFVIASNLKWRFVE